MDSTEIKNIQDLQNNVVKYRINYTKKIEKAFRKKNELELEKISQVQFEDWKDAEIEIPEFKISETSTVCTTDKQKMKEIKRRVLEQIMLLKIIKKRETSEIAKLVDNL